MKRLRIITMVALAGLLTFFVACSESINNAEESIENLEAKSAGSETDDSTPIPGDSCTLSGTLTEQEIAGLMEMREEEKLAGDVYSTFYEQYGQIVFRNISKSEAAHTSAVLYLINGYNLSDPAVEGTGNFTNPLFTELFEQLTTQGAASLVDALKVGAFIEEYDINDLMNLLEETQNEDVKRVYGNLLRASQFHLRAFTNVLERYGETYTPIVISEELYLQIINSSTSENEDNVEDDGWVCPYINN